jgi:hypothetical protein
MAGPSVSATFCNVVIRRSLNPTSLDSSVIRFASASLPDWSSLFRVSESSRRAPNSTVPGPRLTSWAYRTNDSMS